MRLGIDLNSKANDYHSYYVTGIKRALGLYFEMIEINEEANVLAIITITADGIKTETYCNQFINYC